MSKVKAAFDNLLNAIEEDVAERFKKLEAKVEENRLARLKADLDKLNEGHLNTTKGI